MNIILLNKLVFVTLLQLWDATFSYEFVDAIRSFSKTKSRPKRFTGTGAPNIKTSKLIEK